MNLDDESHLSAYLDDELDPADRLAVERAVESSPPLADQLRSIALAREFVAGLDRPSIPRDLAPALGARVCSNRPRARLWSIARPAQILGALSGFSAVAASLLFALIRLNQALHATPERPVDSPVPGLAQQETIPAPRTHPFDPSNLATISAPVPPLLPRLSTGSPPDSSPEVVAPRVEFVPSAPFPAPPGEAAERADRRVIGGILGRTHVRRVVIVTDVIDAADRVRGMIARDARETPEFGRISIRQEIVIDPDHAEAAEVFAVPIDERGRPAFVDRLRKAFPDLIEEGQSSPALVTQLTEVGQVAVLRGLKAAPLGDPPRDFPAYIANREEREKAPFIFEAAPVPSRSSQPAIGRGLGSVAVRPPGDLGDLAPEFIGPPDIHRKPKPDPGERVTLLVWVTRSGRR